MEKAALSIQAEVGRLQEAVAQAQQQVQQVGEEELSDGAGVGSGVGSIEGVGLAQKGVQGHDASMRDETPMVGGGRIS